MTQWRSIKKAAQQAAKGDLVWTVAGTLSTGTTLGPVFQFPGNVRLKRAYAIVETAPTDADLIVDINVGGTSIFGATKLVVDDAATEGSSTTFATSVFTSITANVTMDIDQVGSTVAGADLTVVLEFEPIIR